MSNMKRLIIIRKELEDKRFGIQLYVSGSVARKVFMIILYAVLVFLFIWLKMYNVKFG